MLLGAGRQTSGNLWTSMEKKVFYFAAASVEHYELKRDKDLTLPSVGFLYIDWSKWVRDGEVMIICLDVLSILFWDSIEVFVGRSVLVV